MSPARVLPHLPPPHWQVDGASHLHKGQLWRKQQQRPLLETTHIVLQVKPSKRSGVRKSILWSTELDSLFQARPGKGHTRAGTAGTAAGASRATTRLTQTARLKAQISLSITGCWSQNRTEWGLHPGQHRAPILQHPGREKGKGTGPSPRNGWGGRAGSSSIRGCRAALPTRGAAQRHRPPQPLQPTPSTCPNGSSAPGNRLPAPGGAAPAALTCRTARAGGGSAGPLPEGPRFNRPALPAPLPPLL